MLVEIKKLIKSFDSPNDTQTMTVLKDVNLNVQEGDLISIVGPSGSGKSTLLNMIGTLDNPTSGEIIFDEENISNLNDDKLAQIRNEKIGFIFQLHHLLPQLNVIENVLLPGIPFGKKDNKEKAEELLNFAGLTDHFNHYPSQLSGGELQRVAICRALINNPKLLLADEPTGSLDENRSNEILEFLLKLNEKYNTTIILVTHSEKAARLMNRKFYLNNGTLQEN